MLGNFSFSNPTKINGESAETAYTEREYQDEM